METLNFEKLIQEITGRDFIIDTQDQNLIQEKEYYVYRILPITKRKIGFNWKVAKTEEKVLRSFITSFATKYREPDPSTYNYNYGGKEYTWEGNTEEQKEFAYNHHFTHMYKKETLLKQVQDNFSRPSIEKALLKYGFYSTEYGIGIFAYWTTNYVVNAIDKMKKFLAGKSIPFANEFSEAKWVYRFKLNLSKETHTTILKAFSEI